jgi:hypothetical protein
MGRDAIEWGPRVPRHKLRRLYELDAQGIVDEALVDDVGTTLWVRCRDILTVHAAQQGRVTCPCCRKQGRESVIPRQRGRGGDPRDEVLTCPVCGWAITWGEYYLSYKRRQLNAGGAVEVFARYVEVYPKLRAAREKLLAIDRLVHEFHFSLRDQPDLPTRPVAVNLIEGRLTDVEVFLDELTYGPELPAEVWARYRARLARRDRWLAELRSRRE